MTRHFIPTTIVLALLAAAVLTGCARAARDTTGFAMTDSATVDAEFMETWEAMRTELRQMEFELYTRDKRGLFVAYTDERRDFFVVPRRTQHTFVLEEEPAGTRVTAETIEQVYGVTLLTYPGWHDRPAADNEAVREAMERVRARLGGEPMEPAEAGEQPPTEFEAPSDPPAEVEAEPFDGAGLE